MNETSSMAGRPLNMRGPSPHSQRGITTIAVTVILLVILTLMVLFSTNVGFFEQRTTTNENRAQITEQLAEYAISLGGEYIKANRANVLSNVATTGWFESGAERWKPCPALDASSPHPCDAERDAGRRAEMYYYDNVPATGSIEGLPYSSIAGSATGALTGESATSTARFNANTVVNALLCRIDFDTTNPTAPVPKCELTPASGRDVAITLVAEVDIPGESASATIKETWATVTAPMPSAAVPLIASGLVKGLGNGQIVAAPNAGGYGVPASIWSPEEVDIGDSSPGCPATAGIGSFLTCHMGEYLGTTPISSLLTSCAGAGSSCGCPAMSTTGVDSLSGHSGAQKRESYDILDRDGGCGGPDVQFFPLQPYDRATDASDDSLFEYTFNVDYVVSEGSTTVNTNCGVSGTQNCAAYALLEEFGATQLVNCSTLNTASSGIFYVTGNCDVGNFGSPNNSVIVVVDGAVSINGNVDFYGMIFARSDDAANTADRVSGSGNVKIFGSLLVEGAVNLTGRPHLIYRDVSATSGSYGPIPRNVRFGKVSGSWLDNRVGI